MWTVVAILWTRVFRPPSRATVLTACPTWGRIDSVIDYDPHKWRDHLWDIRGSMVKEIVYRVLAAVAFSACVVAMHRHGVSVAIPSTPHTLVGVALGLLLVFRTNASYDRFWEGRKQWGSIVNESRNLIRSARPWLAGTPELLARLVAWSSALPFATMHHLRGEVGLGAAAGALSADDARAVMASQHVPLAVATRMTDVLVEAHRRGLVSDIAYATLDSIVTQLVDHVGACERIHRTPLPFAYVVHLRRALIIYTFTLPFALVSTFGWWTIAATLGTSYIYFGIEEIGVEIEDPFGLDDNDLPLDRICAMIARDLASASSLEPPAA